MHALVSAMWPSGAAALAQLDIDGFFRSTEFLTVFAQLLSAIVLQVLNLVLFGGSATL